MKQSLFAHARISGLFAVIGLTLAGCAVVASSTGTPEATPATSSKATAHGIVHGGEGLALVASIPTGDVGHGALTSRNGTTGSVGFSSNGTALTLHVDKLSTSQVGPLAVVAVVDPVGEDATCIDTGFRIEFGQITPQGSTPLTADLSVGDLSILSGDPSGINSVFLTSTPQSSSMNTCLASIVARADITWNFAPRRSYIKAVDTGASIGAGGAVAIVDGSPASYVVAPKDLIDEVAARFHLTADDILYLNNARVPNPGSRVLLTGEKLNLILANR